MSTADRHERERRAKRALIIDAARELFAQRGIEAVTLREVAQRIEHSTTAIYVHFKDKQDLVDQMVREDFAAFNGALIAAAATRDPLARLGDLGDAYVRFALTMPRHYQLLFMTPAKASAAPPPPTTDILPGSEGYELLHSTVGACIAAGLFRPELTDNDGIAQAIWACVHGLVSLLIVMGDVHQFAWKSPARLIELSLGSMVRGMLRDPAALPAHAGAPPKVARPRAKRAR